MSRLQRAVRKLVYDGARRAFWALPAPLRSHLHGARHSLVRRLRAGGSGGKPLAGDLDWQRFRDGPLAEGRHRVVFILEASVDWGITLYQRPHHMALALGRIGCLVLYRTTGDGVVGFRPIGSNVWLVNDRNVDSIPGAVRSFYSTTLFADKSHLRAAKNTGLVAYEYIDHIDASISGGSSSLRRLLELKQAAFESADLIVSSARLLHDEAVEACGEHRCLSVPNGVDVAHYRDEHSTTEISQVLKTFMLGHSHIVGYFGAIAPWLWYDLIEEISNLLPEVGFVLIGPDYSGCVPRLPRKSNVIYLGPIDYQKLAAHAGLFDVCFIPFVMGEIARSTSPLKLFEYFALEKPVVVTSDMMECVAYDEVFSGSNAEEFARAIKEALNLRNDPQFKQRLRVLADANSWDVRAEVYISKIEALIAGTRSIS